MDPRFDTIFPKKLSQDLNFYIKFLVEKYQRNFPLVSYSSLLNSSVLAVNDISVETNKTVVDDLWGEPVPKEMPGGFIQPHVNPHINVNELEVFSNPFKVNVRFAYEPKTQNQTKFNQDWTHDLNAIFLVPQFEMMKKTLKIGDRFIWKDAQYDIIRWEYKGRWANTDYFFYYSTYAQPVQIGT
jgi:hypothetical protein